MAGRKKCEPGCTCGHHNRREQRSRIGKELAARAGESEMRSERVRNWWAKQSPEQRQELGAKILAGRRKGGWKRSPEQIAECSAKVKATWATRSKEQRRQQVERALAARTRQVSGLELRVAGVLDALGIAYQPEARIGSITVDFHLLGTKVLFEVDGAYWHALPGVAERDEARMAELQSNGYTVVRLKEHDILIDDLRAVGQALLSALISVN